MKSDRPVNMGIPLGLLGLACVAFMMTGRSQDAGANDIYGPVLQQDVSIPPNEDAIQNIIKSQLDAIRKRDADHAYALTTGTFHEKFDTAGKFLSEMRFFYRPVYNHESYRFLDQTETETGGLIQRVEVNYTHGEPTIVIYRLQRDPSGAWGIDSFTILETDEGQPI